MLQRRNSSASRLCLDAFRFFLVLILTFRSRLIFLRLVVRQRSLSSDALQSTEFKKKKKKITEPLDCYRIACFAYYYIRFGRSTQVDSGRFLQLFAVLSFDCLQFCRGYYIVDFLAGIQAGGFMIIGLPLVLLLLYDCKKYE